MTQSPLPSQTVPPLSAHPVPLAVGVDTHALPVHATVAHFVLLSGQSAVATQATHLPLPSQTVPLSVHGVSAGTSVVVQAPAGARRRGAHGPGGGAVGRGLAGDAVAAAVARGALVVAALGPHRGVVRAARPALAGGRGAGGPGHRAGARVEAAGRSCRSRRSDAAARGAGGAGVESRRRRSTRPGRRWRRRTGPWARTARRARAAHARRRAARWPPVPLELLVPVGAAGARPSTRRRWRSRRPPPCSGSRRAPGGTTTRRRAPRATPTQAPDPTEVRIRTSPSRRRSRGRRPASPRPASPRSPSARSPPARSPSPRARPRR